MNDCHVKHPANNGDTYPQIWDEGLPVMVPLEEGGGGGGGEAARREEEVGFSC